MARQVAADLAEYERLTEEMEREIHYTQTLDWSNAVLEETIADMKNELRAMDEEHSPTDEEALEWKTRYDGQVSLNRELEQQRDNLRSQYEDVRRHFREAYKIESMYPEYDKYSELELARLLKQFERQKHDLASQLKNIQYQIDKESKEFHHYDELRRTYRSDIGITNRDLKHLTNVKRVMERRGPDSPLTSSATLPWNNCNGITDDQRIIDPRRGPVKKAAGVRTLPKVKNAARDQRGGGCEEGAVRRDRRGGGCEEGAVRRDRTAGDCEEGVSDRHQGRTRRKSQSLPPCKTEQAGCRPQHDRRGDK